MGSSGSAVTGGQVRQAILRGFGGPGGGVLRVFCEVRTGLRRKEGGGTAGQDVVLLKYFSPERSAVLVGGGVPPQIKASN